MNARRFVAATAMAVGMAIPSIAAAFPDLYWVIGPTEQMEIMRTHGCFTEGRAGERTAPVYVGPFSKEVLAAEVFISGFNTWYTREGHDHEVTQLRIDAFVEGIGKPGIETDDPLDNRYVHVKLLYVTKDENTSDSDDFNDACIGITVIAKTRR